ncbi:hypothetical protein DY000_02032972 [Brassica cretica]|uniref:Uncharacterized protein n=1 Tax=Brassica cretica TaxID=69181 RepID=A0ABQ7DKE9_BRACR|nr:hypothetical protein DY000_02032972 [Brassica cretica]
MINFPKPAKQVLHLPYLEDPGFTSNQPQEWQPGDLLSHSEALQNILGSTMPHWIRRIPIKPEDQPVCINWPNQHHLRKIFNQFSLVRTKAIYENQEIILTNQETFQEGLSCTITHRIRGILEEVIKPTRSHLWKDWTLFRFNHFQPSQLRPEDILTKPKRPEDIIGDQEEFYKFIPCTSQHRIRRILIYTNLPYMKQTDINVQQIFSYQAMDEISTYQASNKVPRKRSYPLKPSRFKQGQVSYLEPKSHKRLQRLVF